MCSAGLSGPSRTIPPRRVRTLTGRFLSWSGWRCSAEEARVGAIETASDLAAGEDPHVKSDARRMTYVGEVDGGVYEALQRHGADPIALETALERLC